MRKNLGRKPYRNPFYTLRQQKRELHREGNRFLVSAIVGRLPFGSLGIKDNVECELGKAGFNVTGSSCSVAGKNIPPVPLAIDEQILLSQLYESISDGCITVRVELHGVSDDVCHLVIAAIVQAFHAVQDASLYRLETVVYVGYCSFENYIGCIVQEPVLIHACKLMLDGSIFGINRFVIGV